MNGSASAGSPGRFGPLRERGALPPSGDPRGDTESEAGEAVAPILVVEDESDAREAFVELLEHEGYRAVGVENGAAALDLLRSGRRVSLILLDLIMPVMDGWEFCSAVYGDERFAAIPIAIVTANASHDQLPARRRDAGLFVKPIQVDRMLRAIARIVS